MTACTIVLGVALGCATPLRAPSNAPDGMELWAQDTVTAGPGDRWIAEDKLQHFAISFAVTGMAYGAARLALDAGRARPVAVGLAAALGVGKELADARRGGRFSVKDLAWDAVGVTLGFAFTQRIP